MREAPQSPSHSFQEQTLPTEPSSHEPRAWAWAGPSAAHLQQESAPIAIHFGADSDSHRPAHSGDLSSPGFRSSLLRVDRPPPDARAAPQPASGTPR